ncbi:unnamed protein product [Ilex paraguariensis]|uniref:Uncharacterized protein n=1 Tax=Ilex paraguariensis TaxID=185542 RepID=A0ABC8U0J3_9AQUA
MACLRALQECCLSSIGQTAAKIGDHLRVKVLVLQTSLVFVKYAMGVCLTELSAFAWIVISVLMMGIPYHDQNPVCGIGSIFAGTFLLKMITPWDYTVAVATACINILFGFYHFSTHDHPSALPNITASSHPSTLPVTSHPQSSLTSRIFPYSVLHATQSTKCWNGMMRSANLTAQVQPFEGKDTRIFDVVLCYLTPLCTKNISLFWQDFNKFHSFITQ